MPELPEVQTVVDTLRPVAVGRTLASVDVRRPDVVEPRSADLAALLTSRTVISLDRRAKRIVFTLDDGNRFYVHLGMTGRLTVEPADAPLLPHTHVVLHLAGGDPVQVRFRDPRRFGGVWWLGLDRADTLGPEPLTLPPAVLRRQLARTTRAIKTALLDQRVVAGLGNIYVDESLHRAGIHPMTPARDVPRADVARLNRAIKHTLRRALRHGGSTLRDYIDAHGNPGAFQRLHAVYDRADAPCTTCRTPIIRLVLGGRSTHFCPRCQPDRSQR